LGIIVGYDTEEVLNCVFYTALRQVDDFNPAPLYKQQLLNLIEFEARKDFFAFHHKQHEGRSGE